MTELIFLTSKLDKEAALQTVKCRVEISAGRECRKKARRVELSHTHFKVEYGIAYAHATDRDRRAWLKANKIQGWSEDQHKQFDRGGGIPEVRDKLY